MSWQGDVEHSDADITVVKVTEAPDHRPARKQCRLCLGHGSVITKYLGYRCAITNIVCTVPNHGFTIREATSHWYAGEDNIFKIFISRGLFQ